MAAVLCFLVVFKYLDFAAQAAASLDRQNGHLSIDSRWVLPAGISFYTLQAVAYLVEMYRGRIAGAQTLPQFALYLAFFPKALAGPVEPPGQLAPQLAALRTPMPTEIYFGLKTVLWGFFCKLMIADKMAGLAQQVLDQYSIHSGFSILLAVFAYSFRLYFDFYGYTCIAIGVAQSFGIRLSTNFADPYLATSPRHFWRRWHITLMNWLRDYVYIPLGGSRNGALRTLLATLCVFLMSGLWHGASLGFMLWGLYHAFLYASGRVAAQWIAPLFRANGVLSRVAPMARAVSIGITFTLVSVAWLPFAVGDVHTIADILHRIGGVGGDVGQPLVSPIFLRPETLFFVLLLALAFVFDSFGRIGRVLNRVPVTRMEIAQELALVNVLGVLLVLLGDMGSQAFIYFRF